MSLSATGKSTSLCWCRPLCSYMWAAGHVIARSSFYGRLSEPLLRLLKEYPEGLMARVALRASSYHDHTLEHLEDILAENRSVPGTPHVPDAKKRPRRNGKRLTAAVRGVRACSCWCSAVDIPFVPVPPLLNVQFSIVDRLSPAPPTALLKHRVIQDPGHPRHPRRRRTRMRRWP
jgi:hypothetical protein